MSKIAVTESHISIRVLNKHEISLQSKHMHSFGCTAFMGNALMYQRHLPTCDHEIKFLRIY